MKKNSDFQLKRAKQTAEWSYVHNEVETTVANMENWVKILESSARAHLPSTFHMHNQIQIDAIRTTLDHIFSFYAIVLIDTLNSSTPSS